MFDVVYREETLLNVIRSVTRNGRSIVLTAVLALILVYMFSIIGYIFFKDDFLIDVDIDDDVVAGEQIIIAILPKSKIDGPPHTTCIIVIFLRGKTQLDGQKNRLFFRFLCGKTISNFGSEFLTN